MKVTPFGARQKQGLKRSNDLNSRPSSLGEITENDLCIACGACIYACTRQNVRPAYSPFRGSHEVEVVDPGKCRGCDGDCLPVCPSFAVNFRELLGDDEAASRSGRVQGVCIGHSPSYQDDTRSSSGGVVRGMLHHFLERDIPVICLVENEKGYGPEILRSLDRINRVPGSIYHSVSFAGTIGLLREVEAPCLLVALPCQLEGLRNFIHHVEPGLGDKLALTVGLVCGWSFSEHAPKAFVHYKGVKGEVRDFHYRGGDKVGRLKFSPEGGVPQSYSRREFRNFTEKLDYKASFNRFLHRIRCRLCRDHTNILADVVVGDAWLDRYRGEKVSLTVYRTAEGRKALEEAAGRGHVLLQEGGREDIAESQSEDLFLGISAENRGRYRKSRGFPSPEFTFSPYRAEFSSFSVKTRISWEKERRLRGTVRRGHYRTYRLLFALLETGMLPAEIRRRLGRLRGRS